MSLFKLSLHVLSFCILEPQVDGAYKFKVPVSELEQLFNSLSGNMFTVTVDVTERVTGTTLSGSSEIQYYDRAEKMQFMEGAENFKPGMTYTSYVCLLCFNIKSSN